MVFLGKVTTLPYFKTWRTKDLYRRASDCVERPLIATLVLRPLRRLALVQISSTSSSQDKEVYIISALLVYIYIAPIFALYITEKQLIYKCMYISVLYALYSKMLIK